MEFVIIASLVALVFVMAVSGIFDFINEGTQQNEIESLNRIGDMILEETILASNVRDNYYRLFWLPEKVEGVDYIIEVMPLDKPISNNSEVKLTFMQGYDSEYEKIVFLKDIDVLSMQPGCNRITKVDGRIQIREAYYFECS